MAGELWREVLQIGKETTYGTGVSATRKYYARDVSLTRERPPNVHRFATGTRARVRAVTLQAIMSAGAFTLPCSADELIEPLLVGLQGAVTPTTPAGFTNGRLWTFKESETIDSMTVERHDGALIKRSLGTRVGRFTFRGNVREGSEVVCDLFNKDYVALGSLTGALSDRVPTFMEGWETRLYIDALGATPRTNQMSGLLTDWEIVLDLGLDRRYAADNILALKDVVLGEVDVTGTLTFLADTAQANTEFTNWDGETARLIGLEFGQNEVIDAGTNEVQTITEGTAITAGTYKLGFKGQNTSALAFNATAATIQAALEALGSIGPGNVAVTGGPVDVAVVNLTFQNTLGGLDVPLLTSDQTALTGTFTHGTTTPGTGSKRAVTIDLPGNWTAVALNEESQGTRAYQFSFQGVYDVTNAFLVQVRCINNRTAAF